MRLLPAFLLAASLAALPAPARAETTAPCLPDGTGPTCHFWTMRVSDVNDGDTVGGDVLGDGRRKHEDVRFSGVQTMEIKRHNPKHWSGECHSVEPARIVQRLIRRSGGIVRISAQDPRQMQGTRLRRWVAVKQDGRWVDLGDLLVREGHALWMGGQVEWAWNARYARDEQEAVRAGRNLWDSDSCGAGPSQEAPLQLWVNWNPVGDDHENGGEFVKVRNLGDAPVALGGWTIRDASHLYFHVPRGTVLAPHTTVTLHTSGRGIATTSSFFWHIPRLVFENFVPGDRRFLGGGAYLFDPDGDIRAAMQYPCVVDCWNPIQGQLEVTPLPKGEDERVVVRNVSPSTVDLYGYAVEVPGGLLPFDEGTVLAPGGRVVLEVPDVHRMPDLGGFVRVVTFSDVTISCATWGRGRCPSS